MITYLFRFYFLNGHNIRIQIDDFAFRSISKLRDLFAFQLQSMFAHRFVPKHSKHKILSDFLYFIIQYIVRAIRLHYLLSELSFFIRIMLMLVTRGSQRELNVLVKNSIEKVDAMQYTPPSD